VIADELREAGEFIRDVVVDAARISLRPALWIPAVAFSLSADAVVAAVNYPFQSGLPPPPEHAITTMTLVILAKGWFSLTLARVALALLRGQVPGILNHWVPVTTALRIGVVSVALLAPTLLGLVVLIVPGLYLAARWSQVVLLMVDNQARWFDAAEASAWLTVGRRSAVLLVFVAVAVVALPLESLANHITVLAWTWRAVASTFGAALAASLYYQLTVHVP
jgi:hypothetical protein